MKQSLKKKLSQYGKKISEKIQGVFQKESLNRLARQSGFVKRNSSRLKGKEFVELMTVELMQEPEVWYEGLCERLEELNPKARMTPQALEKAGEQ